MTTCEHDQHWMQRALELARNGQGHVEPNPQVGCVIVQENQLVAAGWHQHFGGPHAEIDALQKAGNAAAGSTLYVTLEPCAHHGKTPPCTEAIIAAGVARVVVGQVDPFAQVNGQGIASLEAAGIQVDSGIQQEACRQLNAPYLKRCQSGKPWVLAKWAMTLDGKIAAQDGSSRWISSPASRQIVHQLRGRMDAIIVGRQTALLDDPQLTARPAGSRVATRIVMTTNADLPGHLVLVQTAKDIPTLVVCGPDAPADNRELLLAAGCQLLVCDSTRPPEMIDTLLQELGQREMTNILLEGGGQLLGSWFDADAIDEVHCFLANKIIGGAEAPGPIAGTGRTSMSIACSLDGLHSRPVENDLYLWGHLQKTVAPPATES